MKTVFNKAQLELLDMLADIDSEEELQALKHALSEFFARRAEFFARRADEELERLWQTGQWNEQVLRNFQQAHFRTSYCY